MNKWIIIAVIALIAIYFISKAKLSAKSELVLNGNTPIPPRLSAGVDLTGQMARPFRSQAPQGMELGTIGT